MELDRATKGLNDVNVEEKAKKAKKMFDSVCELARAVTEGNVDRLMDSVKTASRKILPALEGQTYYLYLINERYVMKNIFFCKYFL